MKNNVNDLYRDVSKVFHNKTAKTYFNIEKELPKLIKQFERLIKPDFIFVLNLRSPNKSLIFEKNYTLTSDKEKVTLNLIMNSIPRDALEKIIEIDKLTSTFVAKEYKYPFMYQMNVGFPVSLSEDKFQYLLRTGMVISLGEDGLPFHILGFLRDMSPLCRNKINVEYFISGYDVEKKNMIDFKNLKNKVYQVISYNLSLTKQEKRILKLIEQGKTSLNIAKELNISKSTVDTHRQNIIKKLEVKNSTAAVKKAFEFGILQ
jgi:DNA-binding CsgD family transcriptional regulator